MNFQHLTVTLLGNIHKATADYVSVHDPQHVAETYLKVLIEPLSSEARVWVNSSFDEFGDRIYYEVFRPLVQRGDYSLPLRKRRYLQASQAVAYLLAPGSSEEPQDPPVSTAARRLHVVCQKPHELVDFLNLYIVVAGQFADVAEAALTAGIKATERFWNNFDPYYYIKD